MWSEIDLGLTRKLAEQRAGRQRDDESDEDYAARVEAARPSARVDNARSQRRRDLANENK